MFMELLRRRRSIRLFDERPVEPEKIETLVEAALRGPSSRSLYPWELVVVTEGSVLKDLARARTHGSAFLAGAPLGIAVCADERKSDVWIEDAVIAAILIQLAAESLGLGSCWIQIRERMHSAEVTSRDFVAARLDLPPGVRVEALIAVGYPAERKKPYAGEKLLWAQVHRGAYGRRWR